MYKAKEREFNFPKSQSEIAEIIGIDEATLSRIINGKQTTIKTTAYCITKSLNVDAEVEDYFEKVK